MGMSVVVAFISANKLCTVLLYLRCERGQSACQLQLKHQSVSLLKLEAKCISLH